MSNTLVILSTFLFVLLHSAASQSFKKSVVLSQRRNWIPLGKFTQKVPPIIRARMTSGTGLKATQKADLYVAMYLPEKWHLALKGENCTARLEQMFDQHIIRVPMDASWSDWVNITFPHPTVYLVASVCFTTYALETAGHLTEFELEGCTYEPIPESELKMTPAMYDLTPKQEVPQEKFKSMSLGFGVKPFSIAALVFLLLCFLGTHLLYGSLIKRELLFGFPMLIPTVGLRILMHILLVVEAVLPSRHIYNAALFLDVLCQFEFTAHSLGIALSHPLRPVSSTIISALITAVIFVLLGISSTPYPIIGLRGLLVILLIGCYIYGMKSTTMKRSLKTMTFLMGLIYLLGMITIGIALMSCSEIVTILLNRIEVLMGSTVCPKGGYWIIESDFLFQGIIMGTTLFLTGYFSSKA